jgi:flagellar basal-body rod modification protein FlgD
MNVNQVQSTAGQNAPATAQNGRSGDSFITLLSPQLKAQDPMSPLDPTQFVTQLGQFNMLQQTIEIRQMLQQSQAAASSGKTPAGTTTPTIGGR